MEKQKRKLAIKPLSFTKYCLNNKRRSISMIMALTVSVMAIVVFQMVTHVVMESARFAIEKRLERITVVYPGEEGLVAGEVLEEIESNSNVDKLIPMFVETTDYYHFFGNLNIPVYFINQEDIQSALEGLDMKLKEGRLPQRGKNEILLDWRTANNKNKKLGDFIGREVDEDERMPGKYEIVGILEGDCLIGLHPIESERLSLKNGMLVLPKDGKLEEFNSSFKDVSSKQARFHNTQYGKEVFEESEQSLRTVTAIVSMSILFVMCFAAGNSSYAQYFSRRYEFGVLQSIGYTKSNILFKAAKEIAFTNMAGLIGGLGVSVLLGLAVLKTYFESKGYPFIMFEARGMLQVVVIPICTAVFSLIPSGWILSKIDPMVMIEKFE